MKGDSEGKKLIDRYMGLGRQLLTEPLPSVQKEIIRGRIPPVREAYSLRWKESYQPCNQLGNEHPLLKDRNFLYELITVLKQEGEFL